MIELAVEYLRHELRDHLGLSEHEVLADHAYQLKDYAKGDGIVLSLIGVAEEPALRAGLQARPPAQGPRPEPPRRLSLQVLLASKFGKYEESLAYLSKAIDCFKSRPVFDASTASSRNPFPQSLERLTLDMHNLSMEQSSQLWGILGASYIPSVVYTVRVAGA